MNHTDLCCLTFVAAVIVYDHAVVGKCFFILQLAIFE
jgi:hypothetical protein